MKDNAITGCILGTAVGDALGLPLEGLAPHRANRLFRDRERYHFFFSRGMVSDDTEHTCIVAQALIASNGEETPFIRELARRMRFWLLGLPAGIGFATLRSCVKLWLGFPPSKSGVYSAGNGPAMRTAVIGVCFGDDDQRLAGLVRAATVITHTDPKAYHGALAVALAANLSASTPQVDPADYLNRLHHLLSGGQAGEFLNKIEDAVKSVKSGNPTDTFIRTWNGSKGVSGYIYHTVPAVLHAWLLNPKDFRAALLDIIGCGGDTDTTGAILGAIVGAAVGKEGIPREWIDGLIEWPRTIAWMESLARQLNECLQTGDARTPPRLPVTGVAVRNLAFTLLILLHGFRRLLPPY